MQFSFFTARPLALVAGVIGAASLLTACNKGGNGDFAKTKSGIEYKIFKSVNGKYEPREVASGEDPGYKARIGKFLPLHMEYRTSADSVLMKSRERQFGMPIRFPLDTLRLKGAEQEAISLLQPGDSGVFRFNADTLYMRNAHQPAPAHLKKKGNFITMTIRTEALQTKEQAMASVMSDQQAMMAAQQRKQRAYSESQDKKDEVVLQDYIKKNNLQAQRTPTGIYYVITQPGTGPKPTSGQTVAVNYKGSLLNGKVFDSSEKSGRPIEFPLAQGRVIRGWDEGIGLLNKGSKAILLIPASLAYGEQAMGTDIPANSPLRFDVELVDVK